ncbi:hypothetical protein BUALT_BualtUnG0016300 [Buddleja alternifolia]|uniref:Transposase n=1 Tax=Buddleja alternifolia TaxID=168488 RepID=A0AAV6W6P6_9LAMI|nr:hypothetical protein BUALT_BualtUnG0016300 [Buddleja alternifolia]
MKIMGLPLPDYADFYVWIGGNIEWIPTVRYFGGFKMNNVNEEVICENIDIENPLTENFVLQNDVSGIPDTENLGVENQFTENIDIENPDNENNVENPLTENIEIENPLNENSVLENVVDENPDTENLEIQNLVTENPLTENMDEDFFEQLYNDENLINEAVDLNNEFEDGAWASVSDEDGQNEEGVGGVNEDGHPQEGIEASLSVGEQHDPTLQRDESESGLDSSSVSDCPSWMLEVLEGPDDDDIFQERSPDHAKKLFKALRSFLKDKKRQRVEAQLEEQEVQRRAHEEGWYSDVEEENEDDLDALRGSDEEDERYAVWNDDMEKRGVDLFVGLQFATRKKYKEVLKDWVVRRGCDLKFLKSERDKVTAICKNGCDWRIHASPVMKTSTYQIKSIKEKNICNHRTDNMQADYKYIGKRIQHFIKDNPIEGVESLKNKIRRDVQVECSMHKVYRAKSSMVLKVDRSLALPILEKMYCCLSGCKEGLLDGCRPIIGLDGCFLKGLYKGQLLTAVGRDENDNLVPIVYAMVEVEKFDTWEWFLNLLLRDIGSHEDRARHF